MTQYSGRWQPPRNGSLWKTTSPGGSSPRPTSLIVHSTTKMIAPRWAGQNSAWAIISPPLVEDGAREVEAFVEERRVRGVAHRDAHLARRRDQIVVDDLQGDLVDVCVVHAVLPRSPVVTSEPSRRCSQVAARVDVERRCPGCTSVVAIGFLDDRRAVEVAARRQRRRGRRSACDASPGSRKYDVAPSALATPRRPRGSGAQVGLLGGADGGDLEVRRTRRSRPGCRSRRAAVLARGSSSSSSPAARRRSSARRRARAGCRCRSSARGSASRRRLERRRRPRSPRSADARAARSPQPADDSR